MRFPSATTCGKRSPIPGSRAPGDSVSTPMVVGLLLLLQLLLGVGGSAYGRDSVSQFDWSQHEPKWHATVNGAFKAGQSRRVTQLGFTMPVAQTADTLMFVDFRGRADDLDNDEFNAGLVLRTMSASDWIFGAYGFFDRTDSSQGNVFEQGTFGFEMLNECWDFRVNTYLPELSGQDVGPAPGFGTIALSGNQFVINSQRMIERAYRGIDYEVGRLLTGFGESNELRLFGRECRE